MWPDRVSNPGPLTYESGALPTVLRGPATSYEPDILIIQNAKTNATGKSIAVCQLHVHRFFPPKMFVFGHSCHCACIRFAQLLVDCFGFNGPLRQYFSLYRAVSQREGERGERG